MDYSILIPDCTSYYLDGFKKTEYPAIFQHYRESTKGIFQEMSGMDPTECALGLVDWIDAHPGRFFKARRLADRQMLMLQYLVPAAIKEGQEDFAKALCKVWQERHPKYPFRLGTYEELMKGFNNTLLGFALPNREED